MLARPADADGQEKRRIQANDLYRLRTASDVALAPDGERIAFVVTQIDSTENAYYSHIWVADVEGVWARPYTRGQVRDRNPVWAPDGSKLAFQSNRDGDSQIYVLSMAGGEAQAVTDMETGASNPVWSPDGTKLLFTSRLTSRQLAEAPEGSYDSTDATPDLASADTAMWGSLEAIRNWLAKNASEEDPAVITRLDFQGERSLNPIEHWSHIYEHDLVTATTRRLTDGPFNHGKPQYSPDGRRIAFTATITDGIHPDYMRKNDLYLMDADGGNLQLIEIPGQSVSAAIWSPDGDRLVFASRDTARGSAANTELGLIALGAEGPGDQIRWLTEPLDRGVTGFAWGAEGRSIYFTAVVHGTVPIYRVRLRDGDIRQIVSDERGVRSFDVGPKTLAYVVTHPENPSELYAANADSDDERRVTELNTGCDDPVAERELAVAQKHPCSRRHERLGDRENGEERIPADGPGFACEASGAEGSEAGDASATRYGHLGSATLVTPHRFLDLLVERIEGRRIDARRARVFEDEVGSGHGQALRVWF